MSQVLLLLHGALGDASLIEPLAKELEDTFQVYTLNFSGHGGRPVEEDFSIPLFARDVRQFMRVHALSQVAVFGFSMGGYVALYLAGQEPDRIRKMLTLGTKFDWSPESAAREMRMLEPEKIKEKVPRFAEALRLRHQPEDWERVMAQTRQLMQGLGEAPLLTPAVLAKLGQEVIIGWGEEDNMVSREESKQAAAHIPQGRFHQFGDTPHPIEKVSPHMLAAFLKEQFS